MKLCKKVFSSVIGMCMMVSILPWNVPQANAAANFIGDGTAESPYLISTKEDLVKLSSLINSDNTAADYNKKYYKQTADIDLENENFVPIGTYTGNNKGTGFAGVYDGNYCEISGLYIKRVKNGEDKTKNYTGVFGWSYEGKIRNLSVSGNVDSPESSYVGGIVGELGYKGEIINCSFTGNITGKNKLGGITGSIWQPQTEKTPQETTLTELKNEMNNIAYLKAVREDEARQDKEVDILLATVMNIATIKKRRKSSLKTLLNG